MQTNRAIVGEFLVCVRACPAGLMLTALENFERVDLKRSDVIVHNVAYQQAEHAMSLLAS